MPWCEECSRFLTPTSLGAGGECPSCGRVVAFAGDDHAGAAGGHGAHGEGSDEPRAPWHFKLLVVATVLYLAYRGVQGVAWVAGRL